MPFLGPHLFSKEIHHRFFVSCPNTLRGSVPEASADQSLSQNGRMAVTGLKLFLAAVGKRNCYVGVCSHGCSPEAGYFPGNRN